MISIIDEDDNGADSPGHSVEELDKLMKIKAPKGVARLSMLIGFERHDLEKGPPKKSLNRASFYFAAVLLDDKTDPMVRLAYHKELFDRLDGKPSQAMEVTGKGGGAVKMITAIMSDEEKAQAYKQLME